MEYSEDAGWDSAISPQSARSSNGFPDRPGMAMGMAIMGFGGGAMIGAPLSVALMKFYSSPESTGVGQTFATLGAIYFCFMLVGAFSVRVPEPDWTPASGQIALGKRPALSTHHVHADQAIKTPQFYLLWTMLCCNVSAGIG